MNRERSGRQIIKRIIIRGTLIIDTPTCLGNGDRKGANLILLRDSISNKALLTGSSIAGALRNYLREYEQNATNEPAESLTELLFGSRYGDDGEQSPLIVDDAFSSTIPDVELRSGVKIDATTGTAVNESKYSLELLPAGTEFPLCFELLVQKKNDKLIEALVIALQGLERGEINMGMKKRRGMGITHVAEWQVWQFDLQKRTDRLAWLTLDRAWGNHYAKQPETNKLIAAILKLTLLQKDQRDRFSLKATFRLLSPMLIRSEEGVSTVGAPDTVHQKSHRDGLQPVVSGTSLAGVLRHRAERIVNTLQKDPKQVEELFGFVREESKQAKASRLIVRESVIKGRLAEMVQNRMAIDRFTGGTYHNSLLSEQIIFSSNETRLVVEIEIHQPHPSEVGLILLLLKDLWTGDLPIGGASSIGRGRLQGVNAEMVMSNSRQLNKWRISQEGEQLKVSDATVLEKFVEAFVSEETQEEVA